VKTNELKLLAALVLLVIGGTAWGLHHNVIYTEGEVIHMVYRFTLLLFVPILGLILWRPKPGIWAAVLLGALLLPWQARANSRLVRLHQDVALILAQLETVKAESGTYPDSITPYSTTFGWTKKHMQYKLGNVGPDGNDGGFHLTYFTCSPGTAYWYNSKTGFGYYPD